MAEARCNECGELASTCDCGMDSEGRFDAPAPFTDEDRALLDKERLLLLVEEVRVGATGITPNEAESLARTLAYINELEKQIEDWDDAFCEVITRYQTQSASATDLEILDKLRKGAYGE